MAIRTTGELILVSEYNELATLVNKFFSDASSSLVFGATFAGFPLVIDNASECNAIFAKHASDTSITGSGPFPLSPAPLPTDYIVVERNYELQAVTSGYTIDYNNNTITFNSAINADTVVVYNRTEHRIGYGNIAAEVPLLIGDVVEAEHINGVIDRTNLILEHIGDPGELTRKTTDLVHAADGNTIETTINDDIATGEKYLLMDALTASETTHESMSEVVTGWTNKVVGEYCMTFTSYDQARYFFNAASEIHLDLGMENKNVGIVGDRTDQWVAAIEQMSEVIMSHNLVFDVPGSPYPGITSNIGFYHLTEEYQTIYTSAAYGGVYEQEVSTYLTYSYYANLFVTVDAKYAIDPDSGYFKVVFRFTFDDTALNEDIAMHANITVRAFSKKTTDLVNNSATLNIQEPFLDVITPFTHI